LYSPYKASLNNLNKIGSVHHFDAEAQGRSSILQKKKRLTDGLEHPSIYSSLPCPSYAVAEPGVANI
jgi:hypothetical protein